MAGKKVYAHYHFNSAEERDLLRERYSQKGLSSTIDESKSDITVYQDIPDELSASEEVRKVAPIAKKRTAPKEGPVTKEASRKRATKK